MSIPRGATDGRDFGMVGIASTTRTERGIMSLLLAAGVGATAMYFLDPGRGRRRRHLVRDKIVHAAHVAGESAGTTGRDLANRARGVAAAARRPRTHEEPDDAVIRERVRAELGRVVSHPSAIEVAVDDCVVTLTGPVLEREAADLVSCVKKVRGVTEVVDSLDRYETAGSVPALQGQGRPATRTFELRQENWTPAARLLIGIAGGLLVSRAMRADRHWQLQDSALGLLGAGLLTRAATNLPFDRLVGVGAGRKAITIQDSITIAAPVDDVFAWLLAWDQWPQWMSHVREVTSTGSTEDGGHRTHWVVDGPAGTAVSWDAVTTRVVPNELIAWKTVDGSAIKHAGRIRLTPTEQGTRVDVQMSYNPVLGAAGHAVAALFRRDPRRQLEDDLTRLKTTIETGVPPHDAAASETAAEPVEARSAPPPGL